METTAVADRTDTGELRYGRALVLFLLAYVVITVLAAGFSMVLEALMHAPATGDEAHSASYVLSERFYPLLNFFIWTAFGRIYFGEDADVDSRRRRMEAVRVGALWLALALIADFVGFVLIEQPFSSSAREFYVGRFPWIYLMYLVVFSGPLCAAALRARPRAVVTAPRATEDGGAKEAS